MPLYDFYCKNCQHTFEELISNHAASALCPLCEKEAERMMPRSFAAHYKGSGFYSTDYKKSSQS